MEHFLPDDEEIIKLLRGRKQMLHPLSLSAKSHRKTTE